MTGKSSRLAQQVVAVKAMFSHISLTLQRRILWCKERENSNLQLFRVHRLAWLIVQKQANCDEFNETYSNICIGKIPILKQGSALSVVFQFGCKYTIEDQEIQEGL